MDRGLTHQKNCLLVIKGHFIVEMGVPMDRGLTHPSLVVSFFFRISVEMGVPMDRGLTRITLLNVSCLLTKVEMGVPMDRGLTQSIYFPPLKNLLQ